MYENTSAIDSLTELFSRTYLNYISFHEFCEKESKNCNFIDLIIKHATEKNLTDYLKRRPEIAAQCGLISNVDTFIFRDQIAELLDNLMKDYSKIKGKTFCKDCGEQSFQLRILTINHHVNN